MRKYRRTWPRRSWKRPRPARRRSEARHAHKALSDLLASVHLWRSLGRRPGSGRHAEPQEVRPGAAPALGGVSAYEHFTFGMSLLTSGNPAQAAVRLEQARGKEPTKTSIRETLGRAYYRLGRLDEAEAEFRAVVELAPTNDYAHYCLSRVLCRRGKLGEAVTHLKLARAMSPDRQSYGKWD